MISHIRNSLFIAIILLASGCQVVYESEKPKLIVPTSIMVEKRDNKPKTKKSDRKVISAKKHYEKTGKASWYGPGFHGRKTASGQVYNMNAMTAAHPYLPLSSKVWVENVVTGKKVMVTINDRGPFIGNRIIDLSKAAATELGGLNQGVFEVRITSVTEKELGIQTTAQR